jgi:hypothetical protein
VTKNLQTHILKLNKRWKPDAARKAVASGLEKVFNRARSQFRRRLTSQGVGEFPNTRATDALYNALGSRLRADNQLNGFRFSITVDNEPKGVRASPWEYLLAIDDASTRRGAPSIERIIQWMVDRKISNTTDPGARITTSNGASWTVKGLAYRIRATILRKSARASGYRSLRLINLLDNAVSIAKENGTLKALRLSLVGK